MFASCLQLNTTSHHSTKPFILELFGGTGQAEGLQLDRPALGILAQQYEVVGVGDQDQAVALPVAADLVAVGRQPGIVAGGLTSTTAPLRGLAFPKPAPLHLPGGVEAHVGVAGALLGQLPDAEDPGRRVPPTALSRLVSGV